MEERAVPKSQRQTGARDVLEIEVWTSWTKPQGRGETGSWGGRLRPDPAELRSLDLALKAMGSH